MTTFNSGAYQLDLDPDGPALYRLRDASFETLTDPLPRPARREVLGLPFDLGRIGQSTDSRSIA